VWEPVKEKKKTAVVEDNNNPIFFETIEVLLDFTSKEEAPPIVLNIYDFDDGLISSSSDFLGRALIYVRYRRLNHYSWIKLAFLKTILFPSLSGTKS